MNMRAAAISGGRARRVVVPYAVLREWVSDYSLRAFGVALPDDAEIYGVRDEEGSAGGNETIAIEVRSPRWGELDATPVLIAPPPPGGAP